ncbi:MAG: type II toxin-antitoxin system HicB family antitoxin [Bacillota bacterium]
MTVSFILSDYISKALDNALYDKLDDGTYSGKIPGFHGVVAFGTTLRECESQLQSTLEDWILIGFKLGHPLPIIDDINLNQEPQLEELESM